MSDGRVERGGIGNLGAVLTDTDHATFRVWAPEHRRVDVCLGGKFIALTEESEGIFAGEAEAVDGADYRYVLDGDATLPDPCSRRQPDGILGDSAILDTSAFSDRTRSFVAPLLEDLVIYELHVGTFSQPGTFTGVIERLHQLRELGVRAIELMPIATFPGTRGWGYDGLYTFAPHWSYGSPQELVALIDAAHGADLAVIVDVVYNHLGPGSEKLTAFGPYLVSHDATLWGAAMNYRERAVREWAIQNAEMWVRDYHVDGLRIDAADAIVDDSPTHVLAELASRVHAIHASTLVISEIKVGDLRPLEVWGHDAQWADELHHAVHVLLSDEHDGYYKDYGSVADVARALERPQRDRFVVCSQNHDQVGNRAVGDRMRGEKLRLFAFCVLLSPGTPLMFMGEEYDENHPFLFFTDHIDPKIATATREGRRREFAAFGSFSAAEIPDPQAESTFLRSKLDPTNGDLSMRAYYQDLLQLRTQLKDMPIKTTIDEERRFLTVQRGDIQLAMNFSDVEVDGVAPFSGVVLP